MVDWIAAGLNHLGVKNQTQCANVSCYTSVLKFDDEHDHEVFTAWQQDITTTKANI